MNFTILNEDFTFSLEVNGSGQLTSITATKGTGLTSTNYNCLIQVENESDPLEIFCCGPSGCTVGPCVIS